jgi:hypothetical protein
MRKAKSWFRRLVASLSGADGGSIPVNPYKTSGGYNGTRTG